LLIQKCRLEDYHEPLSEESNEEEKVEEEYEEGEIREDTPANNLTTTNILPLHHGASTTKRVSITLLRSPKID
jgi:hypothetical protein